MEVFGDLSGIKEVDTKSLLSGPGSFKPAVGRERSGTRTFRIPKSI